MEGRMALYHTSMKVFGRAQGVSAVAAAAYRAGVAMCDARTGTNHDYSKRKGVLAVHLLAPPDAPSWTNNADSLWNQAEAAEVRCNARTARELIFCLPHELAEADRTQLAQAVMQSMVERYAVAAMVAVHAPDRGGDQRNFHAHLLMTTRVLGPQGFGAKVAALDARATGPAEVAWIRERVAELTNAALAAAGVSERVDHRTLRAQAAEAEAAGDFEKAARLTREPTRHLGRAATAALRRGEQVQAADSNGAALADHRRALVAWRWAARRGRRRLRALVEARTHSPRGRRAPGATTGPTQGRNPMGGAPRRPRLEDELMQVVQEGRRLAEAVIDAASRREQLAVLLARATDPATREGYRRAVEAHDALDAARAQSIERRARLREARKQRAAEQAVWDAAQTGKPPAWRPAKRQTWEQQRRRLWGRLRKALAHEREAEADLSPVAKAALRAQVAEARQRLADAEAALRRRPAMSQLPLEAAVPASQPHSRPRPH